MRVRRSSLPPVPLQSLAAAVADVAAAASLFFHSITGTSSVRARLAD
jgi:hypothetical protein